MKLQFQPHREALKGPVWSLTVSSERPLEQPGVCVCRVGVVTVYPTTHYPAQGLLRRTVLGANRAGGEGRGSGPWCGQRLWQPLFSCLRGAAGACLPGDTASLLPQVRRELRKLCPSSRPLSRKARSISYLWKGLITSAKLWLGGE